MESIRRPIRDTVELGDFFVVGNESMDVFLVEIVSITDSGIEGCYTAYPGSRQTFYRDYGEAVVLKRDGTYLVSEKTRVYKKE